jgi:hypothetical protein
LKIAYEMTSGMAEAHAKGIVLSDHKMENMLICALGERTDDIAVKFCDYGACFKAGTKPRSNA